MTKKDLLALMLPQIEEIVNKWNWDCIIYENQFDFATSFIIEHCLSDIYDIIVENGGHKITDELSYNKKIEDSIELPINAGDCIDDQGWMYYFYDPNTFTYQEAKKCAYAHFTKKS